MSDNDKILPDMEIGGAKSKKLQGKGLADVPAEDVTEVASDSEAETDSESTDSDSDDEYECKVCDRKFPGYMSLKVHEKGKKHAKMIAKKQMERKLKARAAENDKLSDGEQDSEHLIPEAYAVCRACNKEFTGPESYLLHMKSKVHKHKVLEASILERVREEGEINEEKLKELYNKNRKGSGGNSLDVDEKSHEEFECKDCGKVFSGLTPFTQHLTSKSHAKQVEKKKVLHEVLPEPSDEDGSSHKTKLKDLSSLSLEDDVLICKLCCTSFSGPENAMMHLKSKNHAKNLDKYVRKMEKKKEKKQAKNSGEKEFENRQGKESKDDAKAAIEEQQPTSESASQLDAPP